MSLATGLHEEDFKERKEDAKKWIEDHFQNFKRDLTPVQEKAIERLKNPPSTYDLINIMKQTGGQLDTLPKDWPNIELYKQDKEHIDAAFEHLSGEIPKTFVYQDVNPSYFGLLDDEFIYEDGSLNIANFAELEKKLTYGKFSGYAAVTVSERRNQQDIGDARIKIRIELPNRTNAIPISEDILAIKGENGFLIEQEFSVITMHNTEYIRIEMKYIDKESIDGKIIDKQKELNSNESYREAFGISDKYELFEFLLNDNYTSGILAHTDEALQEIISSINSGGVNLQDLKDAVRFMKYKNGKIIFTDRLLGFVPEIQYGNNMDFKKANSSAGITNSFNLCIAVNGFDYSNENYDYNNLKDYLTHEIAHVLDDRLGNAINQEYLPFSVSDEGFLEHFKHAKTRLTEDIFKYALSSPREFFAEMFRFMYSNEVFNEEKLFEIVEERVPEIVKYIEDVLDYFAGKDIVPKPIDI
ncbi:ADP-ribosyltransferase [Bacillus cereus group sp. BfR-BA-01538]|uniref:anthrax toxin lethal factor-related metalloendopeptidase n=1 Tax=Bacillus cereus group sp. BfR-BA-01538 TaxID=2920373 RepID=UPI001F5813EA